MLNRLEFDEPAPGLAQEIISLTDSSGDAAFFMVIQVISLLQEPIIVSSPIYPVYSDRLKCVQNFNTYIINKNNFCAC